jgi:hypothetical protein
MAMTGKNRIMTYGLPATSAAESVSSSMVMVRPPCCAVLARPDESGPLAAA